MSQYRVRRWTAAVAVVAALVAAAGASAQSNQALPPPGPQVPDRPVNELGPADAPITVIEYCAYAEVACAHLDAVLMGVLKDYPTSVRFVFRAVVVDDTPQASLRFRAAVAAGEQQHFWDMHSMLFANRERDTVDDVRGMAQQLGLDLARFDHEIDSEDTLAAVAGSRQAAAADGVETVPAFRLNGRTLAVRTAKDLRDALIAAGAR